MLIHKNCGGELGIDPKFKPVAPLDAHDETLIGIYCKHCGTRIAVAPMMEIEETNIPRGGTN